MIGERPLKLPGYFARIERKEACACASVRIADSWTRKPPVRGCDAGWLWMRWGLKASPVVAELEEVTSRSPPSRLPSFRSIVRVRTRLGSPDTCPSGSASRFGALGGDPEVIKDGVAHSGDDCTVLSCSAVSPVVLETTRSWMTFRAEGAECPLRSGVPSTPGSSRNVGADRCSMARLYAPTPRMVQPRSVNAIMLRPRGRRSNNVGFGTATSRQSAGASA
jgi:hypothetical protein